MATRIIHLFCQRLSDYYNCLTHRGSEKEHC